MKYGLPTGAVHVDYCPMTTSCLCFSVVSARVLLLVRSISISATHLSNGRFCCRPWPRFATVMKDGILVMVRLKVCYGICRNGSGQGPCLSIGATRSPPYLFRTLCRIPCLQAPTSPRLRFILLPTTTPWISHPSPCRLTYRSYHLSSPSLQR